MEFLDELEIPARPISQEIDVSQVPGLADAVDAAASAAVELSPAEDTDAVLTPSDVPPAPASPEEWGQPPPDALQIPSLPVEALPLPSTRASAPPRPSGRPSGPPKSPEQVLAERRLRAIVRIHTCRDAFRMLGFLGIDEESRKAVGRLLMGIDRRAAADLPAEQQVKLVKSPDKVLAEAPTELLDWLEADLSPIEDRLLELDDGVSRDDFRRRIRKGKHPRKLLARYGRLLASRRMPAGQRRDRFEWLATLLLTTQDDEGRRVPIPPDQARPVLQHLIGGLSHKQNPDELAEAVAYLKEARTKLGQLSGHGEFFDSGFFLDTHGYKVSMRDQLLSPDFLYLSACINADVENCLERWIAELEESYDPNKLTRRGSPREHVMGLLREQEESVDKIFGVKGRRASEVPEAAPKADDKRAAKRSQERKRRARRSVMPEVGLDRQTFTLFALIAVIVGSLGFIGYTTGAIGAPTVEYVEDADLERLSSVLGRAYFTGTGKDKLLRGAVQDRRWDLLSKTEKREAVDALLEKLRERDVLEAKITRLRDGTPVIRIRDGLVVFVDGTL